jgi:Bacterial Ig-like domain
MPGDPTPDAPGVPLTRRQLVLQLGSLGALGVTAGPTVLLAACGGGGGGTAPGDTAAPTVSSTVPASGATGVAASSRPAVTFSEAMNPSSVTGSGFTLVRTGSGAAIDGTVTVSGNTATFAPAADLPGSTQFTATVSTAARDVAGNPLAAPFSWQFTTASTDTTPPTVTSTFPANGSAAAGVNAAVTATFSETMDNTTLTATSVRLVATASGVAVAGGVSVSGRTVTFAPAAPLSPGTQYTGTITTAARDAAGNALASNYSWSFTTAATATTPTLGAHRLVYNPFQVNAGAVATPAMATQASGSTLLACIGRGDIAAHVAPTDNKGNAFTQRDATHAYVPRYPNSGTALYAVDVAAGGSGHVVTASNAISPTDEVTLAVVEVQNGGRVSVRWNMVQAGSALTSQSITTAGPATLVAFWWGDADGSVAHTATPGDGFTQIDALLIAGSLVQCAVAAKSVAAAGTHSITWTATPTQGAQLWLVAVEPA